MADRVKISRIAAASLISVSLVSCASNGEVPVDSACLDQLNKSDASWALKAVVSEKFQPVTRWAVSGGQLYAATWGSDTKPVRTRATAQGLIFYPAYMESLGTDDQIGHAAQQVSPYLKEGVVHRLYVASSCKRPKKIIMTVEVRKGAVERYVFASER